MKDLNHLLIEAEELFLDGEGLLAIKKLEVAAAKYPIEAKNGACKWNVSAKEEDGSTGNEFLTVSIRSTFCSPRSTLGTMFLFSVKEKNNTFLRTGVAPDMNRLRCPLFTFFIGLVQRLGLMPFSNSTVQFFQVKLPLDVPEEHLSFDRYGVILYKGNRYPAIVKNCKIKFA